MHSSTDSIHALLDSVVTLVLLLAARLAIKPPDAEHTYGHGKIESLGGLIGGIVIFLIACFFIYESINRLQSPPPSVLPGLFAIIGGLYTIGIDFFRIIILRRSIKKIGGATLKADFLSRIHGSWFHISCNNWNYLGFIRTVLWRFCCGVNFRRIVSNTEYKISIQDSIRFDRRNITRACKKMLERFQYQQRGS